jgi:hypothetical protein
MRKRGYKHTHETKEKMRQAYLRNINNAVASIPEDTVLNTMLSEPDVIAIFDAMDKEQWNAFKQIVIEYNGKRNKRNTQ